MPPASCCTPLHHTPLLYSRMVAARGKQAPDAVAGALSSGRFRQRWCTMPYHARHPAPNWAAAPSLPRPFWGNRASPQTRQLNVSIPPEQRPFSFTAPTALRSVTVQALQYWRNGRERRDAKPQVRTSKSAVEAGTWLARCYDFRALLASFCGHLSSYISSGNALFELFNAASLVSSLLVAATPFHDS